MSDEIYIHQAADDDVEHQRLTLMAELYDSATHDLLSSAVDLSGARVLEIATGHGGIARWLGDQVGPGGRVIATDIDLRFLSSFSHPQVEVREHNIVTDPLEPNTPRCSGGAAWSTSPLAPATTSATQELPITVSMS